MKPISFITNVGHDNLEHLKLLLKSLKMNLSSKEHEIVVFVDRDNEGIVSYLKGWRPEFKDLKIITHTVPGGYVGYQLNINILVKYAKHDIISYLQSDMVISKDYDVAVLKELEDNCILSATRIEPPLHPESPMTFTANFGVTPGKFHWDEFMNYAEQVKSDKELSYFFAPFTFHRSTWNKVNGHDSLFRRSREDSDILQKFLHSGVKVKQTFQANVYHFTCVSSRGKNWFEDTEEVKKKNDLQLKADNLELRKFVRKWGGFSHGEKLTKYSVDLELLNLEVKDIFGIITIEPFFEKIWVNDERLIKMMIDASNENAIANHLIGLTDAEWEEASKFYNTTNFSSIYQLYQFGDTLDYDCLISVDCSGGDSIDDLFEIASDLSTFMTESDIGDYEYGDAKISLKNKVSTVERNLQAKNPQFDYSLLVIE